MEENKYSGWVQFRVSQSEKEKIKANAESANLSLSAFLRSRALCESSPQKSNAIIPGWLTNGLSEIGNRMNHIQTQFENNEPIDHSIIKLTVHSFKKIVNRIQSNDC